MYFLKNDSRLAASKGIQMKKKKLAHLAATKTKLAEKYEHWAKLASSDPKRTKFRRAAAYFRHEAKMIEIKIGQL